MGAVVGDDVEQQRHQGRARGLAYETRRGEHAAGASAPLGRSRGDQDAVVGRLEKPEAGTAEHQPPYDVARYGVQNYRTMNLLIFGDRIIIMSK